MINLYRKNQSLYRQDNSVTEKTIKYIKYIYAETGQLISHVLCGPTMLGNLHSVMGWPVDRVVPAGLQWEDYVCSVIWNNPSVEGRFPPSDPRYYPDAMETIFGKETTKIDWRHPTPEVLKSYLSSGHAVGVCWKKGSFFHYITIYGVSDAGWMIIDSAPDLNNGKMMDVIPEDSYTYFSKYIITVKEYI